MFESIIDRKVGRKQMEGRQGRGAVDRVRSGAGRLGSGSASRQCCGADWQSVLQSRQAAVLRGRQVRKRQADRGDRQAGKLGRQTDSGAGQAGRQTSREAGPAGRQ